MVFPRGVFKNEPDTLPSLSHKHLSVQTCAYLPMATNENTGELLGLELGTAGRERVAGVVSQSTIWDED